MRTINTYYSREHASIALRMRPPVIFVIALVAFFSVSSFGTQGSLSTPGPAVSLRPAAELARLVASDAREFGTSVAIEGETLVVGAPGTTGNGVRRGAAYVYTRQGENWAFQAKLVDPAPTINPGFGTSVAIQGNRIFVGSPGDDVPPFDDQGSVAIFERNGATWSFIAKLFPSDGRGGLNFGTSIDIDQDLLVVGAPRGEVNGQSRGAAYIFARNGDSWSEISRLTDEVGGQFGSSISVHGDTVVVGAPFGSQNFQAYGFACVYVRNGTAWTLQSRIKAADTTDSDRFGSDVAVEGDKLLVGAYDNRPIGAARSGAAYYFTRTNGSWTEQQKFTAPGAVTGHFGWSVAMSGDRILIGDRLATVNGNSSRGQAYLFVRTASTWRLQNRLITSDGLGADFLGADVALDGNRLVTGAPGVDLVQEGSNEGATYVFVQAPGPPHLRTNLDTGTSNTDGITSVSDLIFDVVGATPGATVELLRNGIVVDSEVVSQDVTAMNDSPPANAVYQYATREIISGQASSLSELVTVNVDTVSPRVWVEQGATQADPTTQSSLLFRLHYNEEIVDFQTSDLSFEGSTANTSPAVVTLSNTPASNSLTVNGIVADGKTVQMHVPAGAVKDLAGNLSVVENSSDNVITLDNVRPTFTINQSSTQADPTTSLPLRYTAVFSEPVTGFTNTDIIVTSQGGSVTGNLVVVTGSGATYEIAVSNLNLNGFPVRVTTSINSAQDALGNFALEPTSTDNFVTLDNVGPTISLGPAPGQANPTSASTINFRIVFNEPVTTFDSSDISLSNSSANVSTATVQVTGSGTTYNIAVSNFTSNGQSVSVRAVAGAVSDPSGNQSLQSQIVSVVADNTGPTATVEQAPGQIDPSAQQPINFRVTFSETVSGFTSSDLSFAGSTADTSVANVAIAGGGTTYNIAVSNVISSGVLRVSIPPGNVTDSIGNANSASTSTDNAVELQIPATASITGRVTDLSSRGLAGVRLEAVLSNGERLYAQTNPFGFYRFASVPTGQIRLIVTKKNRGPAESTFYLLGDATNNNFSIL